MSSYSPALPYPPLPQPPARQADQTAHQYGSLVLVYVLENMITATLSDQDLEAAQAASCYAVAEREELNKIALDRIVTARRLIVRTLNDRTKIREYVLPAVPVQEVIGSTSEGGTKVPVHPRPSTQPPAPAYAQREKVEIQF